MLGAAIWILDHIEDRFKLLQLLDDVDYEEDWSLSPIYDLNHDEDVIQAVVYILKHRYNGEKQILDADTEPGITGDAFHRLLDLVDPQAMRLTVAGVRSLFWKSVDCVFNAEYVIAQKFMDAVAAHDKMIDAYNAQVELACAAIDNFIKWEKQPKENLSFITCHSVNPVL